MSNTDKLISDLAKLIEEMKLAAARALAEKDAELAAAQGQVAAVRAQAFEEAAKDAREIANIPDHMGDIQYRNGALMVAKALDDKAAALREKARKP